MTSRNYNFNDILIIDINELRGALLVEGVVCGHFNGIAFNELNLSTRALQDIQCLEQFAKKIQTKGRTDSFEKTGSYFGSLSVESYGHRVVIDSELFAGDLYSFAHILNGSQMILNTQRLPFKDTNQSIPHKFRERSSS